MSRLPEDANGGPEHHAADDQAKRGIEPSRAGETDGEGAGENGDVGGGITKVVNQQSAEVEVVAAADQAERDATIDGEGDQGHRDHPLLLDGDRMEEPL